MQKELPPNPPSGGNGARVSGSERNRPIDWHLPEFQEIRSAALAVLREINSRCGKNFDEQYPGFRCITDRLIEGHFPEEFAKIITNKLADPHFQRNRNLYRPETMFSAENFEKYLAEEAENFECAPRETDAPRRML